MFRAIRQKITVQAGGRIELRALEFAEGTRAEVIVIEEPAPQTTSRSLTALISEGCGAYAAGSRGGLAAPSARRLGLMGLPTGSRIYLGTNIWIYALEALYRVFHDLGPVVRPN